MRIDWDQRTAGTTPLEIRNAITRATDHGRQPLDLDEIASFLAGVENGSHRYVSRADVANQMGRAEELLGIIAASGLVQIAKIAYGKDATARDHSFSLTSTGWGLMAADKRKRMPRKAADALLHRVVAAAEAINADPSHVYDVCRLAVYGSYLGDAADLGDLDVAYELKARPQQYDEVTTNGHDREDDRLRRERAMQFEEVHPAPPSRSIRRNPWWDYDWTRIVPVRLLRVTRQVSLTSIDHVKELGCAMTDILPERIEHPARSGWKAPQPYRGLIDDRGAALSALRDETTRLIATDPAYRMGSGADHDRSDP